MPSSPPSALSAATLLLSTDLPFPALAAKLQLPLADLLELLDSPDGASNLETLVRLTNLRAQHRQAQSKIIGLAILEDIAKTTTDQQERRRAATALVRSNWTYRPAPAGSLAPRAALSPPSPRLRGEDRLAASSGNSGEACDSPPSHGPPAPHALPHDTSKHTSTPGHLDTSALPPFPDPSILPTLAHSPTDLARALANDLQQPDPCQAFATIRAISTDEFLEEDWEPLLERITPHLNLPRDAHISEPEHHKPLEFEDACRITLSHPTRPSSLILEFFKLKDEPWLLDLFDSG